MRGSAPTVAVQARVQELVRTGGGSHPCCFAVFFFSGSLHSVHRICRIMRHLCSNVKGRIYLITAVCAQGVWIGYVCLAELSV